MANTAEHVNVFDSAHDVFKTLKAQVQELQCALLVEQQQRAEDVSQLRAALEQEKSDRILQNQQQEHALANQAHRMEGAQDRIRFKMGELDRALQKEITDRDVHCQHLGHTLAEEAKRLQSSIDELKASENDHFKSLTDDLATEEKSRKDGEQAADTKLLSEATRLEIESKRIAEDLSNYRTKTDLSRTWHQKFTSGLHADVVWLSNHLQNGGNIADTFKTFKWASIGSDITRPTTVGTTGSGAGFGDTMSTYRS